MWMNSRLGCALIFSDVHVVCGAAIDVISSHVHIFWLHHCSQGLPYVCLKAARRWSQSQPSCPNEIHVGSSFSIYISASTYIACNLEHGCVVSESLEPFVHLAKVAAPWRQCTSVMNGVGSAPQAFQVRSLGLCIR